MNRVYRLVWSHVAGSFVAVGEHAKSHVSGGGRVRRQRALKLLFLSLTLHPFYASADDVNWSSTYPDYLFSTDPTYNYDTVIETGVAFSIDGQNLPNHYAAGTTLNI
ncbi:hypothetical protein I8B11_004263, partial [Salmonella enterica]|nr:hypothetical protein [Salmonella enterica]